MRTGTNNPKANTAATPNFPTTPLLAVSRQRRNVGRIMAAAGGGNNTEILVGVTRGEVRYGPGDVGWKADMAS
jgi:hypothetical protein